MNGRRIGKSTRQGYLVRAMYDWMVDTGQCPHIIVDCKMADVVVPTDYVKDNKITLNLDPGAIIGLEMDPRERHIQFGARFAGKHFDVVVPFRAVVAIYATGTGQGMVFNSPNDDTEPPEPSPKGSHLRVVK